MKTNRRRFFAWLAAPFVAKFRPKAKLPVSGVEIAAKARREAGTVKVTDYLFRNGTMIRLWPEPMPIEFTQWGPTLEEFSRRYPPYLSKLDRLYADIRKEAESDLKFLERDITVIDPNGARRCVTINKTGERT